MAFTPVPSGHIATIVTSLEMTDRPALRPLPASSLRLDRWINPDADKYRILYRRIGEPWLWFSRLTLSSEELTDIIQNPKILIWAVLDPLGIEIGILELDFREEGQCEIAFFGFVPELNGQGHGRWLMAMALQSAWAGEGVERVWVHTCTLDGPGALNFYRKSGFTPYQHLIETFPDPRLSGLISRGSAPQIPIIG